MDRDILSQLVRLKLKDNRLPTGRALGIRETGMFSGGGRPCDACDQRIGSNQKAVLVTVSLEWMSVFFHLDCYKVWEAERFALAEKNGDGQS